MEELRNMKDRCTQQIVQEITTEKSNVGDSVSAEQFGCEQLFDNTISTFIENEPLTGGDDCDTETEVAINDSTINCNILFNSTFWRP